MNAFSSQTLLTAIDSGLPRPRSRPEPKPYSRQKFRSEPLPNCSKIRGKGKDPHTFVHVASAAAEAVGNPWLTFSELWLLTEEEFCSRYPELTPDAARKKMQGVWAKMFNGYGIMEREGAELPVE